MLNINFPKVNDGYWWAVEGHWFWEGGNGPCLTVVLKAETDGYAQRWLLPDKKFKGVRNIGACAILEQDNPTEDDFILAANTILDKLEKDRVEYAKAKESFDAGVAEAERKEAMRAQFVGEYR